MANYKTGAQRYNDRMNKIFEKSEKLGHHSLHSGHEAHESKSQEKKEHMAKKILKPFKKEHGMFKENGERYK